jgi:hypothetical protein
VPALFVRPASRITSSSSCFTLAAMEFWISRQQSQRVGRAAHRATSARAKLCDFADPRPP